jgi:hypothetical protein
LGNEIGIDHKTAAAWLGILEARYIVYFLQPYYKNFNKRIIKAPKLYFYDTGLVANPLGIRQAEGLQYHSSRGSLIENLVITELLKYRYNMGEKLTYIILKIVLAMKFIFSLTKDKNLKPLK